MGQGRKRVFFMVAAALLVSAAPAYAQEIKDEIPHKANGTWAWGLRIGAPLPVGTVGNRQYSLAPALPHLSDTLTVGVLASGFIERALGDYVRGGLEIAWADSTVAELVTERDFISFFYGPYIRIVPFPGRITPYAVASAELYHSFANGLPGFNPVTATPIAGLQELRENAGFTYSVGGGIEGAITKEYAVLVESRFRHYLQGGADPKQLEFMLGFHIWID